MRKEKGHTRRKTQSEQAQVNRKGPGLFGECDLSSGAGKASPSDCPLCRGSILQSQGLCLAHSLQCPGLEQNLEPSWRSINVC